MAVNTFADRICAGDENRSEIIEQGNIEQGNTEQGNTTKVRELPPQSAD